jgi:hypothetical protein
MKDARPQSSLLAASYLGRFDRPAAARSSGLSRRSSALRIWAFVIGLEAGR